MFVRRWDIALISLIFIATVGLTSCYRKNGKGAVVRYDKAQRSLVIKISKIRRQKIIKCCGTKSCLNGRKGTNNTTITQASENSKTQKATATSLKEQVSTMSQEEATTELLKEATETLTPAIVEPEATTETLVATTVEPETTTKSPMTTITSPETQPIITPELTTATSTSTTTTSTTTTTEVPKSTSTATTTSTSTTITETTTTTITTTTTTATTTTTTTPCPDTFNISRVLTTWESARLDCNRMAMDLLILETKVEEGCFFEYLQKLGRSDDYYWIGMNSLGKLSFSWINDALNNLTSWDTGFPTTVPKDNCVTIKNGKWTNQRCTNLNYFACEKSTTITTSSKSCPATSSTYSITKDKQSWDGARTTCAKAGLGDLVSAETPEEDECVRALIRQNGLESEFVWMSLNCINETFYNHWVTGANLSYGSWKPGEPSQYPEERCAIYWNNAWYDLPCFSGTYYVCELSLL